MKVISSKKCVPQHRVVIGRLVKHMKLQKKKMVKLKDGESVRLSLLKCQQEMMMLLKVLTSRRSGY